MNLIQEELLPKLQATCFTKIEEAERQLVANEYSNKIGEIMSGTISRIEGRDVIVSLGRGEAVMPPQEQVNSEKYRVGNN